MQPGEGGYGWPAHARDEHDPRGGRSAAPSQVPPGDGARRPESALVRTADVVHDEPLHPAHSTPYDPHAPLVASQLAPVSTPYQPGDPGPPIPAPLPWHPPLPVQHTVLAIPATYTHDTILASVESARWNANSLPDAAWAPAGPSSSSSSSRHDSLGVGPSSWSGDGRRYSASSASGDSYTTSPLAGGVVALPDVGNETLPPEIKPFVQKLYNLLADPQQYQDVILWNHTGDAFFVAHTDRFTNEVLPAVFGHQNVHSFTRQLNVYRFQRMTVAQLRASLDLEGRVSSQYSGWSHPNFRRGGAGQLHLLTPRPSRARIMRKLEKQSQSGAATSRTSRSSKDAFVSPRTSPLSPNPHLPLPPADLPPPPLATYQLPHLQPPPPPTTQTRTHPAPYYDPNPSPAMQAWPPPPPPQQ